MMRTEQPGDRMRPGALRIVRAPSVTDLAVGLAGHLAANPPADPMAALEVAVPSRGMERWLTQRLAADLGAHDGEAGICANIHFPFPGTVVARVLAAVLGDEPSTVDPWAPQRLAWPLLALLDSLPDQPVNAPLRAHLDDGGQRAERRRFPLARRIADLFDRYAMYRPEMVRRWTAGDDLDVDGAPLTTTVAWQPPLWRALGERLAVPSPDARFRQTVESLRTGAIADPGALPAEVIIFGVQSLPPLHLDLLAALAAHGTGPDGTAIAVTIHALTPCDAWVPGVPAPDVRANPLLAADGVAAAHAHTAFARHEAPPTAPGEQGELFAPTAAAPAVPAVPAGPAAPARTTALGLLQGDIRADRRRRPQGGEAQPLRDGDRSVQVHACHGPMRQVEVLREVLLGLLEDDPTLHPRDVVVLTPDIEGFDPIISAVFSDGDRSGVDRPAVGSRTGVPQLPFTVADRTLRDENAVAQALLAVLSLVTARVGASAVIDLLASGPVSTRFGLTAADAAQLPGWMLGTGTTWGMDADHRKRLIDLDDASHTWARGLDRLVLGAAMADDRSRMVDGIVPYDDVEGHNAELLGRLVIATDALFATLRSLEERRSITAWREALEAAVDALLDPGPGPARDATLTWQLAAVRAALEMMVADSADGEGTPSAVELTLEEVRTVLGSQLGQQPGTAQYGSGAITFSGLIPLRNVPHRVVCLVGLDDGALPRSGHRHGFDLLAAQPQPGDPDPRTEDRQLLLDAILAADDHLVVTYTGHDPRTNDLQQPAVPVTELLEVLDRSLQGEVRDRLLVDHPLQPHSARYFMSDGTDEPAFPQAFDRRQLAAALAAAGEREPAAPFFPSPLPAPGEEELDPTIVPLDDLVRFLEHPIRFLLQRRVGISLGEDDQRLEDRDPTELSHLERWQHGQALLDRTLAGPVQEGWQALTLACGNVPVGGLGEVALDGIESLVGELCRCVEGIAGEAATHPVDVPVVLPDGSSRRVVGSIDVIGSTVVHVSVSTLKAKHRLQTWAKLLALTAAEPDLEPDGRLIARDGTNASDKQLRPLATAFPDDDRDPDEIARAHLADLVDLYVRGHAEVIPLLPEASYAYRCAISKHKSHEQALIAAIQSWENEEGAPGEQHDDYVIQAFGVDADLAAIAGALPFAQVASRVWEPLLVVGGTKA